MDSITVTDVFGRRYQFRYYSALDFPPKTQSLSFTAISTIQASTFLERFPLYELQLLKGYLGRFQPNVIAIGPIRAVGYAMQDGKLQVYPYPEEDKNLDKKIAKVRSRLQMLLNQTLVAERAEALRIKQEFESKNPLQKVAARAGAMRDGVENIVDSLVGFWIDLLGITGSNSANMLLVGYLLQKGTKQNKEDAADFVEKHFATGDSYQQLVKALGFDPTKIDKEQVKTAIAHAKIIMDDEKSMAVIGQFLKEYVAAQHELELYEKVSEAIFGFILSALFAYFAGSALIAMAGKTLAQSKALRAIGAELAKLAELLEKRPKRKGKGGRRIKTKREERDDLFEELDSKNKGKYLRRKNVVYRSADEVNSSFPDGWEPPYKPGTRVTEFETTEDEIFVRVHGDGNKARSWMMRKEAIEGMSPAEIKSKYALPELPEFMSEVHVPRGSKIRTGTVNPLPNFDGVGGSTQYELLQRLPESSFKNTVSIGK